MDPAQVYPFVPPQLPSVDTLADAVDVGADDVPDAVPVLLTVAEPEVDDEEPPQLPKRDWHPVPQ